VAGRLAPCSSSLTSPSAEALAAAGPGLLYGASWAKRFRAATELVGCLTMDDLGHPSALDRPGGGELSRPHHPCAAAAVLRRLQYRCPAHPRRLDLAKLPHGTEHIDNRAAGHSIAAGVAIANGVPSQQKLAELFCRTAIREPAARVRDGKPVVGPTEQWTPPASEGHTTSFSIADKQGNMVCVTQSLGSGSGSGVVCPAPGSA